MSEGHSIDISNLDNQQFTLNKINKFKHYFTAEIKERELMSKRLYVASFNCFDKSLIVLPPKIGSISIASFATVIGTPVAIAGENLSLEFSLSSELVKKL